MIISYESKIAHEKNNDKLRAYYSDYLQGWDVRDENDKIPSWARPVYPARWMVEQDALTNGYRVLDDNTIIPIN